MGPLHALRIVEFGGIGPGPQAAMLLADMGAHVLRIARPPTEDLGIRRPPAMDFVQRGRQAVVLDLKHPAAVTLALDLVAHADGLIEGFRPGTMERLGLGPEVCLARNPRLVYGRMTGWGQTGPLAARAGHDLNYIAITGVLDSIGRAGQPPVPPLNLVGDYGGAAYLVMGMLAAHIDTLRGAPGQVIDAAMCDAAASLMTSTYGMYAAGMLTGERGTNFLDSGAPYYDSYRCADGKWVAIAANERRFFRVLLTRLGLDPQWAERARDRSTWPQLRDLLARTFATQTREDWTVRLADADCCFAPVLSMSEAPLHPHLQTRSTFVKTPGGAYQPAPAPRFSRSIPPPPREPEAVPGEHADDALRAWGLNDEQIAALYYSGALQRPKRQGDAPGGGQQG